ncbi:MAG TPA: choice-of-anchor P family protein [Sphingobium sp.]|nr:choice-of-anchor P family protein [Sphingobium sp.]
MATFSSSAMSAPVFSSSANAASVNLQVKNVIKADAVLAPVSGTTSPDYDNHAGLLSINLGANIFTDLLLSGHAGVKSGIVSTLAQSSSPNSAMASANIANAQAGLYTSVLNALPLATLALTADAISSTSVAGINDTGLFATGASSITNLALSGSLLNILGVSLGTFVDPLPNTVGLAALGLKIIFNEQLTNQTDDSIFMTTNAVHISLTDYLFSGHLLSGDIILGQSHASVTGYAPSVAVPEPAAWALMIGGFGLVGFSLRTRTRTRARARLALA